MPLTWTRGGGRSGTRSRHFFSDNIVAIHPPYTKYTWLVVANISDNRPGFLMEAMIFNHSTDLPPLVGGFFQSNTDFESPTGQQSRLWRRLRKHRRFDIKRHTCREIPVPKAACGRNNSGGDESIAKQYEICLRLNQEETAILQERAKEYGLTKTAYLRALLRNTIPPKNPHEDIDRLRTEVHHIGNNINQLARKFNAGFGTKEDAKTALYLLEQVYELMYEIAKP